MLVLLRVEDGAHMQFSTAYVMQHIWKNLNSVDGNQKQKKGQGRHTWDQNSYEKALFDSQKWFSLPSNSNKLRSYLLMSATYTVVSGMLNSWGSKISHGCLGRVQPKHPFDVK